MSKVSLLDRYKGAMVGVLVGDAIGAPYETWKADKIAADIKARGGLTFFDYENPWKHELGPKILPAGRPTDDSDQTADLAYSLIECNGLNVEHLREALRDSVVQHKSRLWDGTALGAGGTTKKALSDDPEKVKVAMSNPIGTNGSLMRCIPLALLLGTKTSIQFSSNEIWCMAGRSYNCMAAMSAVTHANQDSIDACWLYTKTVGNILKDEEIEWSKLDEIDSKLEMQVIEKLLYQDEYPIDPGQWPERGEAEFSLYTALWCFINSDSFADGIEKAVRVGGDTDTYAAIAGGLLGAYYGYGAIPLEWRQTILGHDVMVEYAEKLYEMSNCS